VYKSIRLHVAQAVFWGMIASASGQPAPDPVWAGSAGAGLALTGGNSDTSNYSFSFDLTRDPGTRNLMKFMGVYLRGSQDDQTTVDRLRLGFRNDYTLDERVFVFGEFSYLRDPFKAIDYLMNPVGGVGYRLKATDRVALAVNGGLGVVWEKNPGLDVDGSGTVNAGQDLSFKLSEFATITQVLSAMWKMDDFEDALYRFSVGLATSLTQRSELKIDFINDFKNLPPSPEIKKSDYTFITSLVFKF
jgi:putative salt-induced outer membrane protein